jgi:hypothetical protein
MSLFQKANLRSRLARKLKFPMKKAAIKRGEKRLYGGFLKIRRPIRRVLKKPP